MTIQYGKPDSVSTDGPKLTLAQFALRYRPSHGDANTNSISMQYRVYTCSPFGGGKGSSIVSATSAEEAKAKVNASGLDVAVSAEVVS